MYLVQVPGVAWKVAGGAEYGLWISGPSARRLSEDGLIILGVIVTQHISKTFAYVFVHQESSLTMKKFTRDRYISPAWNCSAFARS
jgi:hypothetical protein